VAISEEQFHEDIRQFTKTYGWDALEAAFVNNQGFILAKEETLADGATQRVYAHPDGSKVTFTYGKEGHADPA